MPAEKTTPKKSRAGPAGQPPVVAVASAFAGPSSPVEMVSPRRRQFVSKRGRRQLNNEDQVAMSDKEEDEKEEAAAAAHARTRKEEGIVKKEMDADSMFEEICDSDSIASVDEFHESSMSQVSCNSSEEEEMEREESVKVDGCVRNTILQRAAGMLTKKQYKRQNKVSPLSKQRNMRRNFSKMKENEDDSSEESFKDKQFAPHSIFTRFCNQRKRTTRQYQHPENIYVDDGLSSDEDNEGYASRESQPNASLLERLVEMEEEIYALQKDNQALRANEKKNQMILPPPIRLHSELSGKSMSIELSVPQILCDGGYLWKIPFHRSGNPKRRWIQVLPAGGLKTGPNGLFSPSGIHSSSSGKSTSSLLNSNSRRNSRLGEFVTMMAASPVTLIWFDPRCSLHSSPPREMSICDIEAVLGGHKTMAFWQQGAHRGSEALPAPSLCFSLVGKERTLDLHSETPEKARQWREAFMFLVSEHQLQNEENEVRRKRGQSWDISHMSKRTESQYFSGFHSARNTRASYFPICNSDDYPKPKRRDQQYSAGSMPSHYPVNVSWSKGTLKEWRKRLLSSVRKGDTSDVTSLLEGGCPPDALDPQSGETALSVACQLGHVRIVEALLSAGATNDPNPGSGETALQAAVGSSHNLCALALLNQAAALPGQGTMDIVNYLDRHGKAPLHKAASLNDFEMVNILLAHGADIHLRDRHTKRLSWTALHHAAKEGAMMAMSSLLEVCGAEEVIDLPAEVGNCPLHIAVAFSHSEVVLLLLQTAADPNSVNASGLSPYSLAVDNEYMDIAEILLEYLPNSDNRAGKRKVKPLAAPEVVQQNLLPSEDLPRPVIPTMKLREQASKEVGCTTETNVAPEKEVDPHDEGGVHMLNVDGRSLSNPPSMLQKEDKVNDFNSTVNENSMQTEVAKGAESTTTHYHSISTERKPLLDREQEVVHSSCDGEATSMTEAAAEPPGNVCAHLHSRSESEEFFPPWQPMEEFQTKDGDWSSFFSPEGYLYFVLNSSTQQHSQWEDPRLEFVAPVQNEHREDVPVEPIDIPTEVLPPEYNSLIIPAIQPLQLPPPPSPPGEDNKKLKTPAVSPLPPMHNDQKSPSSTCAEMGGNKSSNALQKAVEIAS